MPPAIRGTLKAPKAAMKVRTDPARMPGVMSGRTMYRRTCQRVAPETSPASSMLRSNDSRDDRVVMQV